VSEVPVPYQVVGNATFHLADSIELMESMPSASVQMIFADPPYNLSNNGTTVHAGRRVSVNKGDWDKSKGVEQDFDFHYRWLAQCKRLLTPNGTLWVSGTYHSIYACGYALQLQNWRLLNDIAWFKPNASPNLGCRMFTASHESLIWASVSKHAKHTFHYQEMREGSFPSDVLKRPGKQMRSVWQIPSPGASEKRFGKHPTQKPEALLERIVLASSNPGDTILDPFCGSGTTGVAAIRNGRAFIGIDMNKSYLDQLAIPRITEAVRFTQIALPNFRK